MGQLGSLLTYGLGHIHSRLHSYQVSPLQFFVSFVRSGHLTFADYLLVLRQPHSGVFNYYLVGPHPNSKLAKLIDMYSIVMPDSPMEAKFLKGDNKLIAIERLRANQMGVASRVWKWDHLLESFLDMKTWFWFAMIFSIS